MTSDHRWAFKARFRARAYGWHGSALAGKRLKEAVREIVSVAKSDRVLAAEGCVSLMERLWPALEAIDTSSGALGGAVHRTLHELIPILISAPADLKTHSAWLERLFQAVMDDGVQYLAPVEDHWGEIAVYPSSWLNTQNGFAHRSGAFGSTSHPAVMSSARRSVCPACSRDRREYRRYISWKGHSKFRPRGAARLLWREGPLVLLVLAAAASGLSGLAD
jgi:hypothetical protein